VGAQEGLFHEAVYNPKKKKNHHLLRTAGAVSSRLPPFCRGLVREIGWDKKPTRDTTSTILLTTRLVNYQARRHNIEIKWHQAKVVFASIVSIMPIVKQIIEEEPKSKEVWQAENMIARGVS
jgi:hypothetical protein